MYVNVRFLSLLHASTFTYMPTLYLFAKGPYYLEVVMCTCVKSDLPLFLAHSVI